jgi:hypothetical protein
MTEPISDETLVLSGMAAVADRLDELHVAIEAACRILLVLCFVVGFILGLLLTTRRLP